MPTVSSVASQAQDVRFLSCRHLLAGNCVFSVVCDGERQTFHFYRPKLGRQKGKLLARLLTGPDNTKSYSELGEINPETGEVLLSGKFAIAEGKATVAGALARWLAKLAFEGKDVPEGLELYGTGNCARCGRLLTSVGNPYFPYLGPECGQKG